MVNKGKNQNLSQFYITFKATPWLEEKHVVFGKVKTEMPITEQSVVSRGLTDKLHQPSPALIGGLHQVTFDHGLVGQI